MSVLDKIGLRFNPFDPVASGPPVSGTLEAPHSVATAFRERLNSQRDTAGTKLSVLVGAYGSGKTYCLRWLEREMFPQIHVRPFYFQDPGVQFYDLANSWLRMIGRKNLAKILWELVHTKSLQTEPDFFLSGYEAYARKIRKRADANRLAIPLAERFIESDITSDEEIALCLARIVVETPLKPNFEYRDFLPRSPTTVVAEGEEAKYFEALLKALTAGSGSAGIAFLLDEFEEIGLNDKARRRTAYNYVTTLKRLIDLTSHESSKFWLVLAMTPEAFRQTRINVPAFTDRMASPGAHITLEDQTREEAEQLVRGRLSRARVSADMGGGNDMFPFPNDIGCFGIKVLSSPRRLVQTCSVAISEAKADTAVPFDAAYIEHIVGRLYRV